MTCPSVFIPVIWTNLGQILLLCVIFWQRTHPSACLQCKGCMTKNRGSSEASHNAPQQQNLKMNPSFADVIQLLEALIAPTTNSTQGWINKWTQDHAQCSKPYIFHDKDKNCKTGLLWVMSNQKALKHI